MPRVVRSHEPFFQLQPDSTLDQDNPVSGTPYEVLATTKNVRLLTIGVKCTWTVQPTPLECHITIDGNDLTFTVTDPVSNTWYYCNIQANADETTQELTTTAADIRRQPFLLDGGSVKVEAEITGGTVSNLSARVKYSKKV